MMQVNLAYGKSGLKVNLPSDTTVVEPKYVPAVPDERVAICEALRHPIGSPPLHELIRTGDRVVIVHTDITRPTPNDRMLPILLAELEEAGATVSIK